MKLVLDSKKTFGDLLYLGFSEKFKYEDGKKTKEVEGFACRLASSLMGAQIEVLVPPTVSVDMIQFGRKVAVPEVSCDPYGRSSEGSSFAEVVLRCTADTILDCSMEKTPGSNPGNNPGSNLGNHPGGNQGGKPEEKK